MFPPDSARDAASAPLRLASPSRASWRLAPATAARAPSHRGGAFSRRGAFPARPARDPDELAGAYGAADRVQLAGRGRTTSSR